LTATITDVHTVLQFSRKKLGRKMLTLGLGGLVAGILLLVYGDNDAILPGGIGVLVGVPMTAYELYKTARPGKPMLELTPRGIILRYDLVQEMFLPWHEVHGVGSIEVNGDWHDHSVPGSIATAIRVTKRFYDRTLHVDSNFLRGPDWHRFFITRGDMVDVAFYEQIRPVKAAPLRAEIEARWLAFRRPPQGGDAAGAPAQAITSSPGSTAVMKR
jgi:hypothetical protein